MVVPAPREPYASLEVSLNANLLNIEATPAFGRFTGSRLSWISTWLWPSGEVCYEALLIPDNWLGLNRPTSMLIGFIVNQTSMWIVLFLLGVCMVINGLRFLFNDSYLNWWRRSLWSRFGLSEHHSYLFRDKYGAATKSIVSGITAKKQSLAGLVLFFDELLRLVDAEVDIDWANRTSFEVL
jgi:hypothetical protein